MKSLIEALKNELDKQQDDYVIQFALDTDEGKVFGELNRNDRNRWTLIDAFGESNIDVSKLHGKDAVQAREYLNKLFGTKIKMY